MFHFFSSQSQKINNYLKRMNLHECDGRYQTTFQSVYDAVHSQLKNSKDIKKYIAAISKNQKHPVNILKYCVFCHVVLQLKDNIPQDALLDFLAEILTEIPSLIQKWMLKQQKTDKFQVKNKINKSSYQSSHNNSCHSHKLNKSSSSITTNSSKIEQSSICKQLYLLNKIIQPYIGYLMKMIAAFNDYRQIFQINRAINQDQVWLLINTLRSIISISNKFTRIGRYFNKQYGHLVILLTKALTRDVNKIMYFISLYISQEKTGLKDNERLDNQQLAFILNQISIVNEGLFLLYFSKYFYPKICDIVEPKWINTNSEDFDKLFKKINLSTMTIQNELNVSNISCLL